MAAMIPDPSPAPDPLPVPQPVPEAHPEVASTSTQAVPDLLAWLGSIGGVLGTISFAETNIRRLVSLFRRLEYEKNPHFDGKKHEEEFAWDHKYKGGINMAGDPPYLAAVYVGLDGAGLRGATGEFPQICLWNAHGQLIGYNDQNIRIASKKFRDHEGYNNVKEPSEGMPTIPNGGLSAAGIWPAPGREADFGRNQAVYVTMVKRHFDAICVAAVFITWPDEACWVFDGSWGRASNMSWYHSYIYDTDGRNRECFWLDHRGDLTHKKDLEEEYIASAVEALGRNPREDYPSRLWAANVVPEAGIPEGDNLNEGMRENGVQDYRVPSGVKWHALAFMPRGDDKPEELTVQDFVTDPGKMNWIMNPMHKNVRRGNPVLPIIDPAETYSTKDPKLIWEDTYKQDIPVDCLTDDYYDEQDKLVEPSSGSRCRFYHQWQGYETEDCRTNYKPPAVGARSVKGPNAGYPTPSLQERHARTLVNDQNARGGGATRELCEDPHSVGPSYANHHERVFCRMTDKTLWPFCDSAAGVSRDCFDAEAEVLVDKSRPVEKRTTYWDAIEDWHSGERFKRAA